ncbi:MAG TPA: peptidoglycan bridge formation glycyltransferase FemA/FemB family protein, partial [Candidatus Nanopelagicales bacterium]|nr:peptidoglycan bridge formation glycyltransferase FemA/FemB family protein [Candidatus Nanopelagicales bacterium]
HEGTGRISFLQVPSWAAVKAEWTSESLGWFDGDDIVGAGLVLLRQVPRVKRFLAYLPEGPDIDWTGERTGRDLQEWLDPLAEHLKAIGAFAVKMGPMAVVRRWHADTIKAAIAEGGAKRLRDVEADETFDDALAVADRLRSLGWSQKPDTGAGFGDVQPRYVFQVPLSGRTEGDLLAGFNQLWRRNIKKADKAGVEVVHGGYDDLPAFHEVYVETAARDGFTPRGLAYFQRMWRAMSAEDPSRITLYVARHEGRVLAATTLVRVGAHAWYSYGASSNEGRDVRPSNAVQWAMVRDSLAAGCDVYDLRGISDTLDPDDHLFGLIQFKLGTGGHAQEYLGEWDLALRPVLAKAFDVYLSRR